jgi:uncharacterized membrane protein
MYNGLLLTHSILRYFLLVFLLIVIIQSLLGLINKKPYTATDNRTGLFLFICTHTQLLVGIILYIVSFTGRHRVQFNSETMSNAALRYFAVEHVTAMLIVVVLITVARSTSKKMTDALSKHKRMLIFNLLALLIIMGTVYGVGRGYNTL